MDENNNPHLSKKERRQLRRQEKQTQEQKQTTRVRSKKLVFWGVGIVVLAGVGWGVWAIFFQNNIGINDPTPDLSREYPDEGRNHVTQGDSVKYKTNPPTSGSHWPDPVLDGVYDRSQPDEGIIHSLEHGRVWISYKPSIPDSAKETLRTIAKSQVRVILTERQSNDADIAVAGWRRLDTFNLNTDGSIDEKRIVNFIIRYRDKGPEFVPAMVGKVY